MPTLTEHEGNGVHSDYRQEVAARRAAAIIASGRPLYETLGMGSAAADTLVDRLEELRHYDWEKLARPSGARSFLLRKYVRIAVAVLTDWETDADLIGAVYTLVGADDLPNATVHDVLFGRCMERSNGTDLEPDLMLYRRIAQLLRDGREWRDIMRELALGNDRPINHVSTFLGLEAARQERLLDLAWAAKTHGLSGASWARLEGIPARTATDWYRKVDELLPVSGNDPDDAWFARGLLVDAYGDESVAA